MNNRKFTTIAIAIALALLGYNQLDSINVELPNAGRSADTYSVDQTLLNAFNTQQSDLQVQGAGSVARILADDNNGSRHQRFLLETSLGQTILVAHNIDLAPRIRDLRNGDNVSFYGEYEWNAKGGVIHWTHHDPQNRHPHGWLKHNGRTYQ
jgi:hypothetical protein